MLFTLLINTWGACLERLPWHMHTNNPAIDSSEASLDAVQEL